MGTKEGKTNNRTAYKPEFARYAKGFASLGATDREIAEYLEVTERTVRNWKHAHADLAEALKVGKAAADERVTASLYRRATGYSYDAVKIFWPSGSKEPVYAPYVEHVPPDVLACTFWLKNRRPGEWRDKQEVEHSAFVGITERMRRARERLRTAEVKGR